MDQSDSDPWPWTFPLGCFMPQARGSIYHFSEDTELFTTSIPSSNQGMLQKMNYSATVFCRFVEGFSSGLRSVWAFDEQEEKSPS